METGVRIVKNGKIIRKSKNLRAMRDYARISPVVRVESCDIGEMDNRYNCRYNGTIRVIYADGAESRAQFISYHIMIDWIRNRRSWKNAVHIMQGPDIGYLTKPGIIAGK